MTLGDNSYIVRICSYSHITAIAWVEGLEIAKEIVANGELFGSSVYFITIEGNRRSVYPLEDIIN